MNTQIYTIVDFELVTESSMSAIENSNK